MKKPITPKCRIKNMIRMLFLRSRERAAAIKLHANTCQKCQRKGSVAKGREVKIQVHHPGGIDWDGIADLLRERVLWPAERYEVLCKECHSSEHEKQP